MITYEEPLAMTKAENKRLTIAVKLNAQSTFVEFEVVLNEIPVDKHHLSRTCDHH